ncbi:DeoR/GlpR family DNA-binding transcription regulator [Asaia prunellae]|uniref:DeoR/GlpR family DNA-binding transcription regulator n=1 Tax=Asaia prunellae TaxID=610245 RepID=UPI0004700D5A|nr:DeoR/GlpR family DNA-binding transcription regulator [Asaia prunellae]
MSNAIGVESKAVSARRREILDYVLENGGAQIEELVERFSTSRMTIHRDLHALSEQGLVRKVHGGVTMLASGVMETSVVHRMRRASREKQAIARVAASFIKAGDIIALDDSTTSRTLSENLPLSMPLTVLTNSMGIATQLAGARDISLICLGGKYHPRFDAFLGILCEQGTKSLRANTLFMSVSAVRDLGAYHQEQEIVKCKMALMEIVDRRILMIDSQKFEVTALNRLASLTDFDIVITDSGISESRKNRMLDAGINLHVAQLDTTSPATQGSSLQKQN